jgi:hypothetical protein
MTGDEPSATLDVFNNSKSEAKTLNPRALLLIYPAGTMSRFFI